MNSVHKQCPQTVTQNSALSQDWVGCTGAHPTDLGCAHSAPRLHVPYIVSWRVGCHVTGPAPAVLQAPLAISWRSRHLVVACLMTHPAAKAALLPRYNRLYCDTPRQPNRPPLTIQRRLYRDTTPSGPALAPVMIQNFVSRHSPPMARPLRAGRLYHSVVSCTWLAVSWRATARPCATQPCCVTLQSVVS